MWSIKANSCPASNNRLAKQLAANSADISFGSSLLSASAQPAAYNTTSFGLLVSAMPVPSVGPVQTEPLDLSTTASRGAFDHAVNASLQGTLPRLSTRRTYPLPTLHEHVDLLLALAPELTSNHRSIIKRVLGYLEYRCHSWSQLVPANYNAGHRPEKLERVVNQAIAAGDLCGSARSALNRGFDLALRGPSGFVRAVRGAPQHADLMCELSSQITSQQRARVRRFFWYLKCIERPWPNLVPVVRTPGMRLHILNQVVNDGMLSGALHPNTRFSLNRALDLDLTSVSKQNIANRHGGAIDRISPDRV